jgi:hypothetical protein
MDNQGTQTSEPIITILSDGHIKIGAGYTIGDVLNALEVAKRAVLNIVPFSPPAA